MLSRILILMSFVSFVLSCGKGKDCVGSSYAFTSDTYVYPVKEQVKVGDTIWFENEIGWQLKDLVTGQTVDYRDAENLSFMVSFLKLGKGDILNPGGEDAQDLFGAVYKAGDSIPYTSQLVKAFKFVRSSTNTFYQKVGFIVKAPGNFMLFIHNPSGVYRSSDKCTKASYNLPFSATIDKHLYLYQESRPGYVMTDLERSNCYCFRAIP